MKKSWIILLNGKEIERLDWRTTIQERAKAYKFWYKYAKKEGYDFHVIYRKEGAHFFNIPNYLLLKGI
jgi:hypothetical protein